MIIRNEGRETNSIRDIKFLRRDFLRDKGVSYLVFLGKTQILFSVFLDSDKEDPISVDFSVSPSVLIEEGNSFFHRSCAQDMIKKIFFSMMGDGCLSTKGLSVECQVLQYDGGLSTTIACAFYLVLSLFFQEEREYISVKKIVGASCGIFKGNLVLDLDAQEFFQSEYVIDFLFDEHGDILNIPYFFSRESKGLSLENILKAARASFSALGKMLVFYDAYKGRACANMNREMLAA